MDQLHKRYTVEQVKVILQGYCQGTMSRAEVEEMLQINKTRFLRCSKTIGQTPRPSPFLISVRRPRS